MGTMLSRVLREIAPSGTRCGRLLAYKCPGCKNAHVIPTEHYNDQGSKWTFDGNVEAPTFYPSVDVGRSTSMRCHHWVREGMIEFCMDSFHGMRGLRVPMIPWNPAEDDTGMDD